jgi:anaerobic magnesium-protoporphyrin IX monomethyl ester cyclase
MIKAILFGMPDAIARFDVFASLSNLGIVSLAGNVDPTICDVKVADLIMIRSQWQEYAINLLKEHSPDIVGLSSMSFQSGSALKLARLVKNYDKNILTVIGGYHATLTYDDLSESPDAEFLDFIVRGEGEATFNELVTAVNAGIGYDKILGLSYKTNGVFHHNPTRELLSLDSIQLPNRDARLIKGFNILGMPADTFETSRGCTFSCKFCSISKMYGRSFRKYEISRVIEDIRDAQKHGAKSLFIIDDNVTLDPERFGDICDEIIASKLNSIDYEVQASVKGIAYSEKIVKKMADAGVKVVFIGIESVSKSELDFLGKKSTTSEDTYKAVKYLKDNGIIVVGGFIVGNPDEDEKALWEVYRNAKKLKVDFPIFFILTPHAKTEIREELLDMGVVTNPDNYNTYEGFTANVKTNFLTTQELQETVWKMYDKYFVNPEYLILNQFRKTYPLYFWKTAFGQIPHVIRSFRKTRVETLR